jgi:hypothetical protein
MQKGVDEAAVASWSLFGLGSLVRVAVVFPIFCRESATFRVGGEVNPSYSKTFTEHWELV